MPEAKPVQETTNNLASNRKWVQEEIAKLRNGTLVLVVVAFATLGVLLGYYLFSDVFGSPFKNITYAASDGTELKIAWETKFPSKTRVQYGTNSIYLNETGMSSAFATEHDVDLEGLLPGKPHIFRLVAEDSSGQKHISPFYTAE